MSQNQIVIPTTGTLTGLSLAQEINAALQDIASQNSGGQALTTPVPFQRTARTDLGVIKRRNAANTADVLDGTLAESFVVPKTAAFTAALSDFQRTFLCTGTFAAAFGASASLGDGWFAEYKNVGTGVITLTPNGAETIDGVASVALQPGQSCQACCNNTGLYTIGLAPQAAQIGAFDAWNNDSHTWVYASVSSFTIAGVDLTGTFKKGLKLRWTDSGGVKYGYVASSAYSAGNTTVNIVVNSSYTIANSAITAPAFSFASAPANFPSQFGFASTIAGLAVGAGGIYFSLNNGICTLFFGSALNGTSNSGAFYCSVPIAALTSDSSGYIYGNSLAVYDNGVWQTAPASAGIANGSTTLNFGKSATNFGGNIFGGFTASGGKAVQGTFSYPF